MGLCLIVMTMVAWPPSPYIISQTTSVRYLTNDSWCVQSSLSLLEQYMGLCPMVMIHGRLARFSGLLASCIHKYIMISFKTRSIKLVIIRSSRGSKVLKEHTMNNIHIFTLSCRTITTIWTFGKSKLPQILLISDCPRWDLLSRSSP